MANYGLRGELTTKPPQGAEKRGDADLYVDVPAKDAKELSAKDKVVISVVLIDNCLHILGLNVKYKPFDNLSPVHRDLDVVRLLCERVTVMNRGKIVEQGRAEDVLTDPREECPRALVDAIPRLEPDRL